MSIKSFLRDKVSFFIFYIILMIFLFGIIWFVSVDNSSSNVIYGAIVSIFITAIYLFIYLWNFINTKATINL